MSGPKQYPRSERVRASIKHVLAVEVERMRDELGFVTITDVTLTPDLRHAKAYYTILERVVVSDRGHDKVRDAMSRVTKRLRTAIARQVRLKFAPSLELIEDPVPERAARIDEIIAQLHEHDR